jgi:lambda family phage portal protein
VVVRTRELKDYEDAQLLRQKLAACYVAFITRPVDQLDEGDLPALAEGEKGELGTAHLEPGLTMELEPGQDVTLSNPPGVTNYDEFVTRQLRAIAVGLGVSYEALTGDYSRTNFSSGRMGHLEFHRNVDVWQQGIMVTQFCRPIWSAFLLFALLAGEDVGDQMPEWTTPRRDMIDPTKEVAADIQAIRAGIMTLGDVVRSRGGNLLDVLTRRKAEIELANQLGLTLESDPAQATEWRMPDGATTEITPE